jgi:phage terminase Nu1 subunit (DNA packaging protein)
MGRSGPHLARYEYLGEEMQVASTPRTQRAPLGMTALAEEAEELPQKELRKWGRKRHNRDMAKGWESKSVEEQQSLLSQVPVTEEERQRLSHEHVEKLRQVHALEMNRARVVEQMAKTTNERYRGMLQQELDFLQTEIKKFGE